MSDWGLLLGLRMYAMHSSGSWNPGDQETRLLASPHWSLPNEQQDQKDLQDCHWVRQLSYSWPGVRLSSFSRTGCLTLCCVDKLKGTKKDLLNLPWLWISVQCCAHCASKDPMLLNFSSVPCPLPAWGWGRGWVNPIEHSRGQSPTRLVWPISFNPIEQICITVIAREAKVQLDWYGPLA